MAWLTTLYCEPLHGDISKESREKTLQLYRGTFNGSIDTDVATRGLIFLMLIWLFIMNSLNTTFAHGGESNAYTAIDSSLEIRIYLCF
jgi:hypothetical protein